MQNRRAQTARSLQRAKRLSTVRGIPKRRLRLREHAWPGLRRRRVKLGIARTPLPNLRAKSAPRRRNPGNQTPVDPHLWQHNALAATSKRCGKGILATAARAAGAEAFRPPQASGASPPRPTPGAKVNAPQTNRAARPGAKMTQTRPQNARMTESADRGEKKARKGKEDQRRRAAGRVARRAAANRPPPKKNSASVV